MNESDPLADALAALNAIPQDIVPRRMPSRLQLKAGDEVIVSIPGDVLTDPDGVPIGVEPTEHLAMTVTESGAFVGWVSPSDDDDTRSAA